MGIQDLPMKIYRFFEKIVLPKGKPICCSLKIAFLVTLLLVLIQGIWLTLITFMNIPVKIQPKAHIPLGLFGLQLLFASFMLIVTTYLLITFNKWRDGRLIFLFKIMLGIYILVAILEMFVRMIGNLCHGYYIDILWVFLIGLIQIIGNGYLWVITNTLGQDDADVENATNSLNPSASISPKIVKQSEEKIPKDASLNNPVKPYTINKSMITAQTAVSRSPTKIPSATQASIFRPVTKQSSKTTQTSISNLIK